MTKKELKTTIRAVTVMEKGRVGWALLWSVSSGYGGVIQWTTSPMECSTDAPVHLAREKANKTNLFSCKQNEQIHPPSARWPHTAGRRAWTTSNALCLARSGHTAAKPTDRSTNKQTRLRRQRTDGPVTRLTRTRRRTTRWFGSVTPHVGTPPTRLRA